jgi:hypothetical protein
MSEFSSAANDDDIDIVAAISEHYESLRDVVGRTRGRRRETLQARVDTIEPIVKELSAADDEAEVHRTAMAYHKVVQTSFLPMLTETGRDEVADDMTALEDMLQRRQSAVFGSEDSMSSDEGDQHIIQLAPYAARIANALESITKSMALFVGEPER